ncbi:hypothetical protein MMC19_003295 [Ptychographa xylographoides]|nr:hypothetical protein [Ptychographa xylographoides]
MGLSVPRSKGVLRLASRSGSRSSSLLVSEEALEYGSAPEAGVAEIRGETLEVPAESNPEEPLPGLSRALSWKRTIRQNAADRSRNSIGQVQSLSSGVANWNNKDPEVWPEILPKLRKTPPQQSSNNLRCAKPQASIAEQIGEMIDKALEGRDSSLARSTTLSSVPEFSGDPDIILKDGRRIPRQPQYADEYIQAPAGISPVMGQSALEPHDPSRPCAEKRNEEVEADLMHDDRYSITDTLAYAKDSANIENDNDANREQHGIPIHQPQPRPRACTYTIGRPLATYETQSRRPNKRSVSSPMDPTGENVGYNNDNHEVFVREMHEYHSKGSHKKHCTVPRNKPRKHSTRTHVATVPRPPRRKSSQRSCGNGSAGKRSRWWKLVMVDKDPAGCEQAGVEVDPQVTAWSYGSHPLASIGIHDEKDGYASGPLVEILERACDEQRSATKTPGLPPEMNHTARSTHTLAQCGHVDEDSSFFGSLGPLSFSGDGSLDSYHSIPSSTLGSVAQRDGAGSKAKVKVFSRGSKTRVEVKSGKPRKHVGHGVSKHTGSVQVTVTVNKDVNSVIKVEIQPKNRM